MVKVVDVTKTERNRKGLLKDLEAKAQQVFVGCTVDGHLRNANYLSISETRENKPVASLTLNLRSITVKDPQFLEAARQLAEYFERHVGDEVTIETDYSGIEQAST